MIDLPGVVHVGRAGWWVGAFDERDRQRRQTFAADEGSWPSIADWIHEATEETRLTLAGDRRDGFVPWLREHGFEVTVVPPLGTRVTVATLRSTARVTAFTGGAQDGFSVELTDAGNDEVNVALAAYPTVEKLTVYDAYETSAPLMAALTAAGWSPTVHRVTEPWGVMIHSDGGHRTAYAVQRHIFDEFESPNSPEGDAQLQQWIADLGPVQEIIVKDPGGGSDHLATALRGSGYVVTEKRRPAAPLVAPAGATVGDVQAQLTFRGSGWIDITFRIGDDERLITASWMTSAWADTLTGLTRAVRGERAVIVWSYEPGAYHLVVTPDRNGLADVQLRILREAVFGRPDHPDDGDLQGQWALPPAILASAFSNATHQVIDHLDPDDVVAAWPKGIPHAQLTELDAILDLDRTSPYGHLGERPKFSRARMVTGWPPPASAPWEVCCSV